MTEAREEDRVGGVIAPLLADRQVPDLARLWALIRAWPPDAFALAHTLLAHHAIYRTAVSTDEVEDFTAHVRPDGVPAEADPGLWPNQPAFAAQARLLGAQWRRFAEAATTAAAPARVRPERELARLFRSVERELPVLLRCPRGYAGAGRVGLATLFLLFAAADEACAGLGMPGAPIGGATAYNLDAELLLVDAHHASLARFTPHLVRVLPKTHTPQRGLTLRSLSHHVCAMTHDFGVLWQIPMREVTAPADERLNILIYPWPLVIDPDRDVAPARRYDTSLPDGWGYFDFAPHQPFDPAAVAGLVRAARAQQRGVDLVVLPEAAVTEAEAAALVRALDDEGVKLVLTGVRGERLNAARLFLDGFVFEQAKHHRWCLDRPQIEQYGLQRALNPHVNWWENITLAPRRLGFVGVSSWLTLCHVICEDLARLDPVDQLIRSVGPNLLIALLQDGPQLPQRWGARYASIYAEDPGTSVLTVSSLGMALASAPPPGVAPSRCVALWRDPLGGAQQLALAPDHEGLWLSVCARRVTEFAADGRSDEGMGSQLVLVDHQSVRR